MFNFQTLRVWLNNLAHSLPFETIFIDFISSNNFEPKACIEFQLVRYLNDKILVKICILAKKIPHVPNKCTFHIWKNKFIGIESIFGRTYRHPLKNQHACAFCFSKNGCDRPIEIIVHGKCIKLWSDAMGYDSRPLSSCSLLLRCLLFMGMQTCIVFIMLSFGIILTQPIMPRKMMTVQKWK